MDKALPVTIGCNTSKAVWDALHAAFQHSSKFRELRLKDELHVIKKGTLTVSQYGLHFKSICDQVSDLGCRLDAANESHWFLRGLGATFVQFTSLKMSSLPTVVDLIPKAENFEIFTRCVERTAPTPTAAFYASTNCSSSSR